MMKQEDFQNAVQKIHARAQLEEKVLSGKPSGYSRSLGRSCYLRYATCLATALVFVLCFVFLARTLKTAVPADMSSSKPVASPQTAAPNGLYHDDKVRNILLLGVDGNPKSDVGRSDCIMILTIDSRSGSQRLILTPFPRDLYVDIPGHGKNKINAAYTLGGAALAKETIEKNFKLDIDDYAEVDFAGLIKIVDRMGGIRVTLSEQEAKLVNKYSGEPKKPLKAGSSVLTGRQALYYSRIRSIDSDLQRVQREQTVVIGMVNQFKKMDSATLTEVVQDILPSLKTSMDKNDVLTLVMNASAYCNYTIICIGPREDLLQQKQVAVQGSTMDVLVPDLDKYSARLYRLIYQNEAS
jgi:cell envelope-related function transcriptional attenuator common domain